MEALPRRGVAAKKQTKSSGNAAFFAFKASLQIYPRNCGALSQLCANCGPMRGKAHFVLNKYRKIGL
jgi:hypothetical protein